MMFRLLALAAAAAVTHAAVAAAQDRTPVPVAGAGTVTLSRADYDRLLELSAHRPAGTPLAPLPAALTRADIRVRVAGASARATMRIDGEAFRPGVSKVTLIKNATLLDARMDNRALPVAVDGPSHVALVNGPATFSATLEVGAAVAISPGRGSFVLPVPEAGAATATIEVPGEQADVHVPGALIVRRTSANGRTTIDVTLTPGSQTEVWWSTHDVAPATASARDVRLLSDVKSVVTIADADVRLVSLLNVTVVQGEPSQLMVAIPAGYELAGVTGASLDRSEARPGGVALFLTDPALRRHQFLLSLERPQAGGSFKLQTELPSIPAAQRETGEVAVEGLGTMEVSSGEMPGLRRIDVRELDPAVASVARDSLLAAYRYQRAADEPLALTFDVRRFADAAVLAAVAERAVATTLLTSEGRTLTEITLWIRNRAQPFMKVALPAGASIVSVEVAGAPASPVEGKDGTRVPLLRPGLRTDGVYAVSFVYLQGGTPLAKKGEAQMLLPKMDVPVNVVEWELFVPDQVRADRFDGNVVAAGLLPVGRIAVDGLPTASLDNGARGGRVSSLTIAQPGQVAGRVVDASGSPLPGATVTVETAAGKQTLYTASDGSFVANNVSQGQVTVSGELSGFSGERKVLQMAQGGLEVNMSLGVNAVVETVTVTAASPTVQVQTTNRADEVRARAKVETNQAPSLNVQNLQRRAAGVLPIRIDVPRAGSSHRFVRPLVIDEETVLTFRYKRR